jgi:hypothetical protein
MCTAGCLAHRCCGLLQWHMRSRFFRLGQSAVVTRSSDVKFGSQSSHAIAVLLSPHIAIFRSSIASDPRFGLLQFTEHHDALLVDHYPSSYCTISY